MSKRIHIKLNVPETALVMSIASALRLRPEDMAKQATLAFAQQVLQEVKEKQAKAQAELQEEINSNAGQEAGNVET